MIFGVSGERPHLEDLGGHGVHGAHLFPHERRRLLRLERRQPKVGYLDLKRVAHLFILSTAHTHHTDQIRMKRSRKWPFSIFLSAEGPMIGTIIFSSFKSLQGTKKGVDVSNLAHKFASRQQRRDGRRDGGRGGPVDDGRVSGVEPLHALCCVAGHAHALEEGHLLAHRRLDEQPGTQDRMDGLDGWGRQVSG
jgi:hypothetical protein